MQSATAPERYIPIGKRPRNCKACGGVYFSDAIDTQTHPGKCAYEFRSANLMGIPVGEWRSAVGADDNRDMPAPTQLAPTQTRAASGDMRVLFWPDTHLPYQDKRAVDLALKIADYFRPELIVMLGDVLDCNGFSRFEYDTTDPRTFFKTELDEWHSLARSICDAAPGPKKIFIRGNHEARIERWLWKHPHLKGDEAFDLSARMRLAQYGFDPEIKEEIELCQRSLTAKHGRFLGGQQAGTAARKEMARTGTSGVSGHVHTAATVTQRDKRGLRIWIESGHLSENPQHYTTELQNWCHAVTVGELSTTGNDFSLELIPFRLSYKARVYGKELAA